MFHTLTTSSTTNTTNRQNRLRASTVAALVSLALAASACGGAAPTDTADDGAADIDLVAEVAPVVVPDSPAPTIDDEPEPAPAPTPVPIDDEPSTPDNPPADHDTNDTNGTADNDSNDTNGSDGSESDGSDDNGDSDGSDDNGSDDNDTPTDPGNPPTGPTRPDFTDAVDQPTEAKLPDAPQADMEVAVRNVKIEASPECFANGLDSRFFHTTHAPVAVVLDTNGISETQFTSMAHDVTELTDQLRELSISDGALRGYASSDLGYAVTVQVQGAVTGGIVVDWAQTATAPGTYTSPTFSGPTDDCDISINFLILELD